MKYNWSNFRLRDGILDLLFPKFCFNCGREGFYLCEDCRALIEILERQFCPGCRKNTINGRTCPSCKKFVKLDGLFFAVSYQNNLVIKMIQQFKYEPFTRELKTPLTYLIITHFQLLTNPPPFFGGGSVFLLIPVPIEKRRLKWRGFNQAEEIAKELVKFLEIPLINDVLFRTKRTLPQVELSGREREENLKGAFLAKSKDKIIGRKILLIDDVYTTGATMQECALVLKNSGAKEVWGVAIARE